MDAPTTDGPLAIMLAVAVPLHIQQFQARGPLTSPEWRAICAAGDAALEQGDVLQFGGRPGEAALLFNAAARAIALLAFVPGGVTFCGAHYEATWPPGMSPAVPPPQMIYPRLLPYRRGPLGRLAVRRYPQGGICLDLVGDRDVVLARLTTEPLTALAADEVWLTAAGRAVLVGTGLLLNTSPADQPRYRLEARLVDCALSPPEVGSP